MESRDCNTTANSYLERKLALSDAIELLSGKWKLSLLLNLYHNGTLRFKDLLDTSGGISPKVLSKELQVLEQHLMITRTVNNTRPVTVVYQLTNYALQATPVINALIQFGLKHRAAIKSHLAEPDIAKQSLSSHSLR